VNTAITRILTIALLPAAAASGATASYNGGNYAQAFDGLPSSGTYTLSGAGPFEVADAPISATGMTGWAIYKFAGTGTNLEFKVQDGSLSGSAGRGAISFGTASEADRALGGLATSNVAAGFGLTLTNTSASTFQSFTLSYTGEQWRDGGAAEADKLSFAYGVNSALDSASLVSAASLDFIAPITNNDDAALNGNLAANRRAISATVTGLQWAPGQTLVLRWTDADITGQDDGLAIDGLTFSAAVPEPTTAGVAMMAAGVMAARRRRSA